MSKSLGQLHLARRPAGPERRPRLPAARAPLPLPLADRDHPGHRRARPRPVSPGSTRWRVDSAWPTRSPAVRWSTSQADGIAARRGRAGCASASAWTTTSTPPGRWQPCSSWCVTRTPPADAGDDRRAQRRRAAPSQCCAVRSGSRCTGRSTKKLTTATAERWSHDVIAPGPKRDWALADALRDELERSGMARRGRARRHPHPPPMNAP